MSDAVPEFVTENVRIDALRPHPQNYRHHPEDQLAQIARSIQEHGIYKNIVVANDNTILAGHGLVLACRLLGIETVPIKRVPVDPFSRQALKIIVGDNELANLAEDDDRALTEMLKSLAQEGDLLGTGYDEKMLAGLLMTTRPESEIADFDEAAEWVGMPGYEPGKEPPRVVVQFESEEQRVAFMAHIGASVINKKTTKVWSIWWPERQKEDLASVRFDGAAPAVASEPVAPEPEAR